MKFMGVLENDFIEVHELITYGHTDTNQPPCVYSFFQSETF